jgi:hypothetical protein
METVGGVVSLPATTARENEAVRTTGPAVPVMVIVDVANGVVADVTIVTVLAHGGLQVAGLKVAVAPPGRPEAEKVTGVVAPAVSVVLIEFEVEPPRTTVTFPAVVRANANDAAGVVTLTGGEDGADSLPVAS